MADYRLYLLDEKGKIASAEWLEAKGDDEAIIVVRSRKCGQKCEIWKGQRHVADVPAALG